MTDHPVIIEVAVNETALREKHGNARIPYAPREIVDAACRAREAGAAILHWHGRDPLSGEPRNDVDLYLEVIEGVRARCDILIHPTLGYITQHAVDDRIRHIVAANANPATRVDFAPVDFGSLNVDYWDVDAKRWETEDKIYLNPRKNLTAVLEALRDHDVRTDAVCWEVGHIRTAKRYQEIGLLRDPFWLLVFTGARMPTGASQTLPGLLAMLAELAPDEPWFVCNWNGDVLPAAAWAITLGGHVRCGLGDWQYVERGSPDNAQIVDWVASIARAVGRPVATPDDARAILRLPAPVAM